MALVLKDRVKETTTTTGTGTYTLAGAVTGFETFGEIGNGNTTYYTCTDGTDFETGIGTYTSSGTTLARTTILQSSNSDSAVNWSSGTRTIFCTLPAEKMVFQDAGGDVSIDSGTIDGVTLGTNSAVTEAQIDNININGNSITSTNSNGNITIDPNGTGNVSIGNFTFDADQTVGSGQNDFVLTYDNSTGTIGLEAATDSSALALVFAIALG
jgi:hypothetical protein|tara:strand:- start:4727 stop:5362 length:636 start_codon:yes stop_codon:yes gene_type:complete